MNHLIVKQRHFHHHRHKLNVLSKATSNLWQDVEQYILCGSLNFAPLGLFLVIFISTVIEKHIIA